MKQPNAQLVINSKDRLQRQGLAVTRYQPYNNFTLSKVGQNIIQGSINKLQVGEIRFPYDIPNIVNGVTNYFTVSFTTGSPITDVPVTLIQGFYTGDELATSITNRIQAALTTAGVPAGNYLGITYDEDNNRFTWVNPSATYNYTVTVTLAGIPIPTDATYVKTLLWLLGDDSGASVDIPIPGNTSVPMLKSAPLIFTDFIDIVSSKLSGNVYIRDGSTCPPGIPFRPDLLCRLYIADETSTNNQASGAMQGTRPFVIHRQFKNAKLIANTIENSINDVDIALLDDQGKPLPVTLLDPNAPNTAIPTPRDFQLTLNVYEPDIQNDGIKHVGGGTQIPYGRY